MGEVYRARDPRLGRDVAIKVVLGAFAEPLDRVEAHRVDERIKKLLRLTHLGAVPSPDFVFGATATAPEATLPVADDLTGSSSLEL